MEGILDILLLFILSVISLIIIGLVAGFSPTLYLAQVTTSVAKSKAAQRIAASLIIGVLLATVFLLVLFQIFSLSSLLTIIDSTVRALLVSVVFNIIVGLVFIFGGLRYMHTSDTKQAYDADPEKLTRYKGFGALLGLGFFKTITSISGATAIFIGGNIIASTSDFLFERALLTVTFLAANITPFAVLYLFLQRKPDQLTTLVNKTKMRLSKVNYRTTVGFAAIILGGAIVIFNVMMALFY